MVRALEPGTWDGFSGLAERHNCVFGGGWCTWFHTMSVEKERTSAGNRSLKRRLVDEGRAHAALVYDGDEAVAWGEYGSPDELPNIYHRNQYDAERDVRPSARTPPRLPDHLYLRGQALPPTGVVGGRPSRCPRPDGSRRRWRRGGIPPRHGRQEEIRRLQLNAGHLGERGLRVYPQQGRGQLRHAPNRALTRRPRLLLTEPYYGLSRALMARRSFIALYPSAAFSRGSVRSKTLPGSISRFQMSWMSSGRKRRTGAG